ncbi:MAG TPA: VWA domain-containing protein [Terriglobales bacterium]|nr:VWA domain-containing protein [Terriglobales bacterium]
MVQSVLTLLFVLVLSAYGVGQASSISENDYCESAIVPLSAISGRKVMRDLQSDELAVKIGGRPVPIKSLTFDEHPQRVILFVDTSGSMATDSYPSGSRWSFAQRITTFALDTIPQNASIALVTFNEKTQLIGFTGRKQIAADITALSDKQGKGRTALYDAIHESVASLGAPRFGDAVYLVTDGGDNHSHVQFGRVRDELIANRVRAFVFLIRDTVPQSEEEFAGVTRMEDLTVRTGGYLVSIPRFGLGDKEQALLQQVKSLITDQLQGAYRLQLGLSTPLVNRQSLKVSLARDQKQKLKSVYLNYPRTIGPCSF